ncbi:N-acetylglucosamine kinase [Nonomuraea soli]|uniref:N-acetylglucosamine kinase-like BadF-type ATPase n=1 Tax=Nonomuraea soli TaxID=1032476 RepID=A0A7W0CRV6_9ACTN|nr:BadF/BadG/BcrA/BcrD ATPase family protein [Nonomuraea soli]MBA2896194.1 N-acetylglucosamine kinase-like BadF-type ATPase [Nonomuraea soli]
MTPPLVAGIDVGGTKTHVRLTAGDLVVHDEVVSSGGWSATPVEPAAAWLARLLPSGARPAALAVGAHGCEEREHCLRLQKALQHRLEPPVLVVNDAELLVPAAGLEQGIALIAGTGAIAVATGGDELLRAGGWGWVLSDDGSASALVREAARAVLARADAGHGPDALGRLLLESTGSPGIAALAHTLSWGDGPEHWGRHAPAVVAAAEAGSADARRVLDQGARALAALVRTLTGRGARGPVVAAGGLVTHVPAYWDSVRRALDDLVPGTRALLLDRPPVEGAVALARRLVP